jgi:hypothetical protein
MHEKRAWGAGVPNLKDFNMCLLGSWVKRFIRDEHKLWRRIVEKKYRSRENIFMWIEMLHLPFGKG